MHGPFILLLSFLAVFFVYNSWLSCTQVSLSKLYFFLSGLIVTVLLLEEGFLSSLMQGMELAGWKMSHSQQEEGGRVYKLRQHTHSKMQALMFQPHGCCH